MEALDVEEVAAWCRSDRVLESAWVMRHDEGLVVTDRGETDQWLGTDEVFPRPPDEVIAGICSRFGVAVVPAGDGFTLELIVRPDDDVRAAVRAVMSAQDVVFATSRASHEAGGGWGEDVLATGLDSRLPFDEG